MKEEKQSRSIHGLSWESEEQQLAKTITVAQRNLERTQGYIKELSDDLHEMLETYGAKDKEALTLWHNTESQLKANEQDLVRCEKARKKPYFGRIDFKDPKVAGEESYYIGRIGITENGADPMVIDWRAPVASVYYENSIGPCEYVVRKEGTYRIDLKRKRTYEIANDTLLDFFDSDVVANDDLLTKYLAKSKKAVLGEIIATIQKEQNAIIRKSPKTNLIVQGVAGSGKTTVAMHRISYILYNYEEFRPEDFYIIGSNRILLDYITSVLPDLDVYGIAQMTMEQLFVRLLYEDWDPHTYTISSLDKKDALACIKGSYEWFHELEEFCREYERSIIPIKEVRIEKTNVLLLEEERIAAYLDEHPALSMQSKINMLNEILLSKLENELIGKHVTYTAVEKKELQRLYRFHFGKDVWKGSIFELYESFLELQQSKGKEVFVEGNAFDVYDLAALAYLYKRIKETDGIREASHVIIDEAQDFGMMAYGVLHYCMRGCTYTIMGDVSQNIHYGYGLNDWEELKGLVLRGGFDSFGLLKKSYRNTVEISNFATEILRHGNFPIYPVEPIIRHGNAVSITECKTEEEMLTKTADTIRGWQQEGHETIAVICRDEAEAAMVSGKLGSKITITDSNLKTAEFGSGVMVLPVEYTKGLEFDAVMMYHPSVESYPAEDQFVKLLYVASTRALHELAVVHLGDLTELIAIPVSARKRMKSLEPKIVAKKEQPKKTVAKPVEKKEAAVNKQAVNEPVVKQPTVKQQAKPESSLKQTKPSLTTSAVTKQAPVRQGEPKPPVAAVRTETLTRKYKGVEQTNPSPYKFCETVDSTILRPKEPGRIDSSLRGARKTKRSIDLMSAYGILRLTPITESMIRVQFKQGEAADFTPRYWDCEAESPVAWKAKAEGTQIVVMTKQLVVKIEKRTGALQFFDQKGSLLLQEKSALPRQMELGMQGYETWNYFDWPATEKLMAKGILDESLEPMNQKARYISFGGKKQRMPLLLSRNGYGLGIAAEDTVICCDIPMYGPYVYTKGMEQIDYFFIYGENRKKILELYKEMTKPF